MERSVVGRTTATVGETHMVWKEMCFPRMAWISSQGGRRKSLLYPLQLSAGLPAGAGKVQACLVLVWTHRESSELFHLVKFVTLAAA